MEHDLKKQLHLGALVILFLSLLQCAASSDSTGSCQGLWSLRVFFLSFRWNLIQGIYIYCIVQVRRLFFVNIIGQGRSFLWSMHLR
jgi:hypothetical protein